MVTNSTISGNSANGALSYGGGIKNFNSTLTLTNSIVTLNNASDDDEISGAMSPESGFNLIGIDPHFVRNPGPGADGTWGTEDDDYGDLRLTDHSPAIEMGNNAFVPAEVVTDRDGNARIYGSRVDIGAYEFQDAPPTGRETPQTVVTTTDDVFDLYDGEISLREAVWHAGAGDQVTFDAALDGGEIVLDDVSIWLDHSVIVDASGLESLEINADGKSRAFAISGEEVELIGLTITGGKAALGGGIYNSGTLTLTASTVSGNSANDLSVNRGGGIYNSGTLTVINSTISSNLTETGGGIFNDNGMVTVIGSVISGNSASDLAGGIYNGGTLEVIGSTISGNSTSEQGGGIYGSGTLTVTNSIVSLNIGDSGADIGGSLTVDSGFNLVGVDPRFVRAPNPGADGIWGTEDDDPGDLHLTAESPAINLGNDSAVPPELATDLDGLPRIHGGRVDIGAYEYQADPAAGRETPSAVVTTLADTVDLYDGLMSLREALFYGSVEEIVGPITFDAALDTGEITLAGSSLSVDWPVQIDASSLSSLSVNADNKSRVFTILGDEVGLVGLTITGGVAWRGGGIYNSGTLTVIGSTISDNSTDGHGGGISNSGTLTVIDSTITGNLANRNGGGIYGSGTMTVTGSTISDNSTRSYGGGIHNMVGTLTVTNSTISGNSSDRDGGGIHSRGGTLTVNNSTISGNSAERNGAGIISNSSTLTVTNSTISGNSADDGGGIHNDTGTMTITGSTISGNSADGNGGAIYNSSGTVTLTDSTVLDNSATNGGGIYNANTLTLNNSTIADNSATEGGGIYNSQTLTVTSSIFSGNSASYKGGGIRNAYPATLAVSGSTIFGNSAEHGGGMYGSGTMTVLGSTISGNSAYRGGGILISPGWGTLMAHNTILAGNTTDNDGPDVYGLLEDTGSHNLIGDGSEMSGIADGINGNLVGTAESPIDPRFVRMPSPGADGLWGTEDDDYGDLHLLPDSPAIDAGDDAWAVDPDGNPLLTDMDGNPRISGERVDMGAYEFQVAPGEIRGSVFNDRDGDGVWDQRERGMARWTVYLDQNENGLWDSDELWALTGSRGEYSFAEVPMGTYIVGLVPRSGWTQTLPDPDAGGFHTVTVGSGQTVEDVLFGNRPGRRTGRGANGNNGHVFSEESDWLSQLDSAAPKSARKSRPERAVGGTQWLVDSKQWLVDSD